MAIFHCYVSLPEGIYIYIYQHHGSVMGDWNVWERTDQSMADAKAGTRWHQFQPGRPVFVVRFLMLSGFKNWVYKKYVYYHVYACFTIFLVIYSLWLFNIAMENGP